MALSLAKNAFASAPSSFGNPVENPFALPDDPATRVSLSSSVSFRGAPLKLHAGLRPLHLKHLVIGRPSCLDRLNPLDRGDNFGRPFPSPGSFCQVVPQRQFPGATRVHRRLRVSAAVKEVTGSLMKGNGLRFGVVVGRFNEIITRPLLAGALEAFTRYQVREEDIDVIWVPGSFEIPVVAQKLASSEKYHAILCIGAVVRGATTHYDAVANSAASGIMSASLSSNVPCIFGVLTTENMEQAIDRAGGKAGNKGAEAAVTALEMASLFQHHLGGGWKERA